MFLQVCVCPRGLSTPGGGDPPEMATAAGGTYPTGMHSCSCLFWLIEVLYVTEEMLLLVFVCVLEMLTLKNTAYVSLNIGGFPKCIIC